MASIAAVFAWVAATLLAYIYVGYPIALWIIAKIRGRMVTQTEIRPFVTLAISAFNEEAVIGRKLENSLALDYPKDRYEVLVVSDGSTDRTDEIVNGFRPQGVKLVRLLKRQGKTPGLNAAVAEARGDIVVFSDANIYYQPDALKNLVRNFADPEVGCVVGDSRYLDTGETAAHTQESGYWNYERFVRAMESRIGSTVGGDGAIFAIRRKLYKPLPADAVHDLVVPLQIVEQGHRSVFDLEAVGLEPSTGNFKGEFRRKRRIVNQSWHGVMSMPQILNPLRVGIFAWQLWSHKVLRWLVLPILLLAAISCMVASPLGLHYRLGAWGFFVSLVIAGLGTLVRDRFRRSGWLLHAMMYFYLVNIAAVLGIAKAVVGQVEVFWSPERR
jgi:cellulose synthase/poly-beta-1,6-N-acetylglucosamine synthase-like glycosyltransferase